MTLLRSILIMYALFNYISPTLTLTKKPTPVTKKPIILPKKPTTHPKERFNYNKTGEELKVAVADLQSTSDDSTEREELDNIVKLINSKNKAAIRMGKPYVQYFKNLATKRRDVKNNRNLILSKRRFLNWFKNLFVPTTTPKTITTTTNTTSKLKAGRYADEQSLNNVLNSLIDVLNKLNDNIANQNRMNETLGFYVVKVPNEHLKIPITTENIKHETNGSVSIKRSKREVEKTEEQVKNNNQTENNVQPNVLADNATFSSINNNDIQKVGIKKTKMVEKITNDKNAQQNIDEIPVTVENVKNRRKREINANTTETAVSETLISVRNGTENLKNETNILETIVTNVTNNLESRMNGRRNFTPQNNIRGKLFAHLFDIFDEIKNKMAPVLAVKNGYNKSVAFKIGYITANLDTLGSNLARLKTDMEGNAQSWGDHEILDLFDVLKIHHNVVLKLIDSLKFYLKGDTDYSFNK